MKGTHMNRHCTLELRSLNHMWGCSRVLSSQISCLKMKMLKPHRAHILAVFLEEEDILCLNNPWRFPDFNPIKLGWSWNSHSRMKLYSEDPLELRSLLHNWGCSSMLYARLEFMDKNAAVTQNSHCCCFSWRRGYLPYV